MVIQLVGGLRAGMGYCGVTNIRNSSKPDCEDYRSPAS
jgi:hypothetical protein